MPDAPLRFAGYAGLFDLADADQDTIRKGAFATTLSNRQAPIPLLWQHRPHEPIGVIERIYEDARGLAVIGRIDKLQSRAAALLQSGEVDGLSFGYRAREAQTTSAGRELLGIDLFEVSLVTQPLQHGARVHLVT
ncbi:MAG: HK97 family phage prohead protease [Erythrobacter sp.]|nr:HK97 family phage prohead protease [Erythrobacter sp.]